MLVNRAPFLAEFCNFDSKVDPIEDEPDPELPDTTELEEPPRMRPWPEELPLAEEKVLLRLEAIGSPDDAGIALDEL